MKDLYLLTTSYISSYYDRKSSVYSKLKHLTSFARSTFQALTYMIDGLSWKQMTMYEFYASFSRTFLTDSYSLSTSGYILCKDIQKSLKTKGVHINTNIMVDKVDVNEKKIAFSNGKHISYSSSDIVVLCVDPFSLKYLLKNWYSKYANDKMYGSISLIFYIENLDNEIDELKICTNTDWNIICTKILPEKLLSCVICNFTNKSDNTGKRSIETNPQDLITEVWNQINKVEKFNKYQKYKICWGSLWNSKLQKWEIQQTSAGYSTHSIPFKLDDNLYCCGMKSKRNTPYASIEASCEVANTFYNTYLGKKYVYKPLSIEHILFILFILIWYFTYL